MLVVASDVVSGYNLSEVTMVTMKKFIDDDTIAIAIAKLEIHAKHTIG